MSAFFDYSVSIYGTEIDFIGALVSYITSLDSRITCSSDVDDEFDSTKWEEGTDHVPTFNFSINNKISFSFIRSTWNGNNQKLSQNSMSYKFSCDNSIVNAYFMGGYDDAPYSSVLTRTFRVSSIISDNFILIAFGSYDGGTNTSIVYAENSSKYYFGIATNKTWSKVSIFNISSMTLVNIDTSVQGSFLSRFSYAAPAGQIDYIKSSVYITGNPAQKVFDIPSIYDCTTVTAGDTVSLKDGAYLAVGTHQLVKV